MENLIIIYKQIRLIQVFKKKYRFCLVNIIMKLVLSLAIVLALASCASFLEEQQPMENKIYKIKLDKTET